MTTRRKLTLINGTMDKKVIFLCIRQTNSFEVICEPGNIAVPPLPFPDDDWDNFDQTDDQAE